MICRIVQYHLASVDGREPRTFASRHLAGCSACQRQQEGLAGLDQELRGSRSFAPAPTFKPATTGPRTALPAFAALACSIAVVVLIIKLPAQEPAIDVPSQPVVAHHPQPSVPSQPMTHAAEPPPLAPALTRRWDIPQLRRIASQAPMEQELAALRQDGQRGLDAIMAIGRRK